MVTLFDQEKVPELVDIRGRNKTGLNHVAHEKVTNPFVKAEKRDRLYSVCLPELMNTIWANYPEYALSFNVHEQAGLNDSTGLLLQLVGADVINEDHEDKVPF